MSYIFAAAAATYGAMRDDFDVHVETAYLAAEEATRGHLLNREGRAAGVDPRDLFVGPAARAARYASPELLDHWQHDAARPHLASFEVAWMDAQDRRWHA